MWKNPISMAHFIKMYKRQLLTILYHRKSFYFHQLHKHNSWRVPSRFRTMKNSPFGLKNFAKPDTASRNEAKSCIDSLDRWINQRNFFIVLQSYVCLRETHEPERQIVDVPPLLGALQLSRKKHSTPTLTNDLFLEW